MNFAEEYEQATDTARSRGWGAPYAVGGVWYTASSEGDTLLGPFADLDALVGATGADVSQELIEHLKGEVTAVAEQQTPYALGDESAIIQQGRYLLSTTSTGLTVIIDEYPTLSDIAVAAQKYSANKGAAAFVPYVRFDVYQAALVEALRVGAGLPK